MTVKELKSILDMLDDNVEVKIGFGEKAKPIRFIAPYEDSIMLHTDLYMEEPEHTFVETLAMFGKDYDRR